MRIVLFAHPSLGAKLLEALVEHGEEVVAVFIPGSDPAKSSPLKIAAIKYNIPFHEPGHMKDNGVYETLTQYRPELGILAFVQDIVPTSILDCPAQGTIMYHPSLLPRHRGGSAINWAIIMGDKKTGLSIIRPDDGIDTGPILLQKEVAISPDDTVGSIFFDKLYPMGIAALVEAVDLIKQGRAPCLPQDESRATYEPLCRERHTVIDWNQPAQTVYDLIRGSNPHPGASTTHDGRKITILDSAMLADITATPGEVVRVDEAGLAVACREGGILVRQLKPAGGDKTGAADFARAVGLTPGAHLG